MTNLNVCKLAVASLFAVVLATSCNVQGDDTDKFQGNSGLQSDADSQTSTDTDSMTGTETDSDTQGQNTESETTTHSDLMTDSGATTVTDTGLSASTMLANPVTTADYTLVLDESNHEVMFDSYLDAYYDVKFTLVDLKNLLNELDPDLYWTEINGTANCPLAGTVTQTSSSDDNATQWVVITTQDCEFDFGMFDIDYEYTYVDSVGTQTIFATYSDNDRSFTFQSVDVNDWQNDNSYEAFINDSELGQYFVRAEDQYTYDFSIYGSNHSYVKRETLPITDETYTACEYAYTLNGNAVVSDDCVSYFDIDSATGSWSTSGGQDPVSAANAIYQLDVTADANFSITLDTTSYTSTYLYVLDQNFEILSESSYANYGRYETSALGIELTVGTYYVTAATYEQSMAGDFELVIASDIDSMSLLTLYQQAEAFDETSTQNIDTVTGNWVNSAGSFYLSGDSIFELTVAQEANFLIQLNSKVDNYLYLLDHNFEYLESNDDYNDEDYNAGIAKTLSAGTYYITATTFDAGESGSFELDVNSNIANSAVLSVYQ